MSGSFPGCRNLQTIFLILQGHQALNQEGRRRRFAREDGVDSAGWNEEPYDRMRYGFAKVQRDEQIEDDVNG
jgi:hypothetical protein